MQVNLPNKAWCWTVPVASGLAESSRQLQQGVGDARCIREQRGSLRPPNGRTAPSEAGRQLAWCYNRAPCVQIPRHRPMGWEFNVARAIGPAGSDTTCAPVWAGRDGEVGRETHRSKSGDRIRRGRELAESQFRFDFPFPVLSKPATTVIPRYVWVGDRMVISSTRTTRF